MQETQELGFDPWSGRSPEGENGNPPQYSCLGNSMNRGAWQATVQRVAKSWTQLRLYSTAQHSRAAVKVCSSEGSDVPLRHRVSSQKVLAVCVHSTK